MIPFYIGYDSREDVVYQVARMSLSQTPQANVILIVQDALRAHRIYTRERDSRAATDFSLTRFLVPYLAGQEHEWGIFADCDFLFTRDVLKALEPFLDDSKALMVVKHDSRAQNADQDGGGDPAYVPAQELVIVHRMEPETRGERRPGCFSGQLGRTELAASVPLAR